MNREPIHGPVRRQHLRPRALLTLAVPVLLACSLPALGQDVPRRGPADSETRDRLLTLASGQVLRGATRKNEDSWELRQGSGWTSLPVQYVTQVRLERDVLREQKQRRSGVRSHDTEARLEVARWELAEGLYTEGLRDLDRVLEDEPDHTGALLLLANPRLPFAMPRGEDGGDAGLVELVRYGGQAPRSIQELVVRALAQRVSAHGESEALQSELARRLRSSKSNERAFAALACRRIFPRGIALQEMLRRALVDPSSEVRIGASLALRDTGEEGLMLPLIRALESPSSVMRTHAARSLGTMGFAAAVEPLATRLVTLRTAAGGDGWQAPRSHVFVGRQVAFVQDFEPEVATSAVIANPQIGVAMEGATLDVRVHGVGGMGGGGGVSYSHATETKALREALGSITGAEVRDSNTAWRGWWSDHGSDWLARHLPERPVEAGTSVPGVEVPGTTDSDPEPAAG